MPRLPTWTRMVHSLTSRARGSNANVSPQSTSDLACFRWDLHLGQRGRGQITLLQGYLSSVHGIWSRRRRSWFERVEGRGEGGRF